MTMTLLNTRLQVGAGGERVASFQDVRGAYRALHHLVDSGFPVDAVTIEPRHLRADPDAVADLCGPSRGWQVFASFLSAVVAGTAVGVGTESFAFGLAAVAASFAITWPLAIALSNIRRRVRRKRAARVAHRVVADRFDILCSRRAEEANYLLATWWDPQAPPAPGGFARPQDPHVS
jgi:hypothetical protein